MPRPPAGQVQTVLGALTPDAMGVTLPHEHLLIDFKVMFSEPAAASDKGRAWEQVTLDEILLFKRAGGQTVVGPPPRTLGRDPQALARLARATGLNVVMGAGYYVGASHPADMRS